MSRQLPFQHMFSDDSVQVISLRGFHSASSFVPHRHSFYMLLWVTKGRGLHRINYRECEQKEGQVFLLHDGCVHQVIEYPEDGVMVLFKSAVFEKFISQHPNQYYAGLCDPNSRKPFTTLEEASAHTFETMMALLQQELTHNPKSPLLPQYLSLMLFHLNRHYISDENKYISTEARHMQKLRQLISQHYKEHRNADFYGAQLGLSARKINDVCKKATGRLVQDLVAERLLSECEALLGGTDLQVKEIIYELGFTDHAHFAYFFRQNKGTTPSDYRRRLQG